MLLHESFLHPFSGNPGPATLAFSGQVAVQRMEGLATEKAGFHHGTKAMGDLPSCHSQQFVSCLVRLLDPESSSGGLFCHHASAIKSTGLTPSRDLITIMVVVVAESSRTHGMNPYNPYNP
jgi:hypothetical protein